METGWKYLGGKWYYFDASGGMATNRWVEDYYLTESGAMATNTWIGKYNVGPDGKWIPGYKKIIED
jgi:glucan-binding YG repeat protein